MPYADIADKRAYENRSYHAKVKMKMKMKTEAEAEAVLTKVSSKFNSKNLQLMLCKWGKV